MTTFMYFEILSNISTGTGDCDIFLNQLSRNIMDNDHDFKRFFATLDIINGLN